MGYRCARTKLFFFLTEGLRTGSTNKSVLRNASRGVLRVSRGLIKLHGESTNAGHRYMSSGDQQSIFWGEAPPKGSYSILFTIFDTKGTPLVFLLLPTNGTPFTYVTREDSWPSLELCIHLNCCKCTVFNEWITKPKRSGDFFTGSKMHLFVLF